MKLQFLTLWAINGALDEEKLKAQLREMKQAGFDGTIFHPRYYPDKPPFMGEAYLRMLSAAILFAKELGLEFWIYDENGWPSASGNGRVLEQFPDSRCEWLVFRGGQVCTDSRCSFNTFDRAQMQFFVQTIYDGYRLGLEPEAFDYVTGFFSDEVGFLDGHGASIDKGGVPYCKEAEQRVRAALGEFRAELLFIEDEGAVQVRSVYWQALTDVLAEAFYETVNAWCERYGKRYTAHLKGEENIFFQIPCSGSCYPHLKRVNTPAVDALERCPGNHYYPRIASSLARQFHDSQCLAEALGGSGWGLSPADVERYVDWLAGCGVNRFAFHLWQYERSSASVRDWPPNIPVGMSWRHALPELLARLKAKWADRTRTPKVLLVAPVRGCTAHFQPQEAMVLNEHNGDGVPDTPAGRISKAFSDLAELLHQAGADFDVAEERIIEEHGAISAGKLTIGKAAYTTVITGEGCRWERPDVLSGVNAIDGADLKWRFAGMAGRNQFPLTWDASCHARVALSAPLTGLRIHLLDAVERLTVNDVSLTGERADDGWYYAVPDELLAGGDVIDIAVVTVEDGEQSPFGFVDGTFLVKNRQPLENKDTHQWRAEDCFYLAPVQGEIDCADLIGAGFPFCRDGVYVTALRYVDEQGVMRLGHVEADAARVLAQGVESGWVWGDAWSLPTALPEGFHPVTLHLLPSTYNTYGPHHYYQGDRHLTSPAQYMGEKNFADDPDAPAYTLAPQWHLVRFGVR